MTRILMSVLAATGLALAGAGCSRATTEPGAAPAPTGTPTTTPDAGDGATDQETRVRISITVGEERLAATLPDTPAARDLRAQLPVGLEMTEHGGVEKTGRLPAPLSLEGQPEGADPDVWAADRIAHAIREAVLVERDRCARVAETLPFSASQMDDGRSGDIAAAIREGRTP